jgi:hypothetical protein
VATRKIVRCSRGHLYSSIWIWGTSIKAVRWGRRRWQWCPVGGHFAMTERVDPATLSAEEQSAAQSVRDAPLP